MPTSEDQTTGSLASRLKPLDGLMALLLLMYTADAVAHPGRLDPWLLSHGITGLAPKIALLAAPPLLAVLIYAFRRWRRPVPG